jgi:hypothetical protein
MEDKVLDRWLARHSFPNTDDVEVRRAFFDSMPDHIKALWNIRKAKMEIEAPEFNAATVARARKRMARVDNMQPDLRAIVHEYGLEIVQEFLNVLGARPKTIKHLIDTVLHRDLADGQARFKINKSPYAKRNPAEYEDYYSAR